MVTRWNMTAVDAGMHPRCVARSGAGSPVKFLTSVRRVVMCMVLTSYRLDLSVHICCAKCVRFFNPLLFNIGGNDGT